MSDATSSVLIAVEEPIVGRILEHKLRREGHQVTTVHGIEAVRSALARDGVDVLLLSAALGDAFPFAVGASPRAGWFLLTGAFDDPTVLHRAMDAGAAGAVRLPFKPTQVAAQVATLLTLVAR